MPQTEHNTGICSVITDNATEYTNSETRDFFFSYWPLRQLQAEGELYFKNF